MLPPRLGVTGVTHTPAHRKGRVLAPQSQGSRGPSSGPTSGQKPATGAGGRRWFLGRVCFFFFFYQNLSKLWGRHTARHSHAKSNNAGQQGVINGLSSEKPGRRRNRSWLSIMGLTHLSRPSLSLFSAPGTCVLSSPRLVGELLQVRIANATPSF